LTDFRKDSLLAPLGGVEMTDHDRIAALFSSIPALTEGQVYWLSQVVGIFRAPHSFQLLETSLLDDVTLNNFGDALRIHHSFSAESFSKDKFEYVLEEVLNLSGRDARSFGRRQVGADIEIDGVNVSLKTQADKNIKDDVIWISKFRELGGAPWGDNLDDLVGLRQLFLDHMNAYERIFTLRALSRGPNWKYELVEIPKALLEMASGGRLEMKMDSRQFPKPGYCYVEDESGQQLFQLYFDGGGERKLQVKHLLKSKCIVHATWEFTIEAELV
jgi:type II restriction enzyme